MPTLLLPPRLTDDSVKLSRTCVAAHWETLRLDRWRAPENLDPADIAVYGGYFIVLAHDLGISLLTPPVDWLAGLPRSLTRRTVRFMTLAQARTDRAFYKPSDDKCFLAKIYNDGTELPPPGQLPDDVPVLVSDIVRWEIEFRCFLLEGSVVTLSPYLRDHDRLETADGPFPATDPEFAAAEQFANHVARETTGTLPPGVVIDIGLLQNGTAREWAVIGANQAWGAGIYGCDPAAILPILRRVCVPTQTLSASDRPWAAAI